MTTRNERGLTLIETMIALAVLIGVVVGVAEIIHNMSSGVIKNQVEQHASVETGRLIDQLQADASSAIAVFVPPTDVLHKSNADGHEIDFYTRNGSSAASFWAYNYQAGTTVYNGTIQKYTYQWGQTATPDGNPIVGMLGLKAVSQSASALNDPMFGGYTPVVHDLNVNYTGVVGGNRVTTVTVTGQAAQVTHDARTVELMAGVLPSGQKIVTAMWTPTPPPGPMTATNASFLAPKDTPKTITVTDGSTSYIGPITEAPYGANNTCSGVATIAPGPGSSTTVPLGNNGALPFTVTPNPALAAAASCTVMFTDGFNKTATSTITIAYNPPVASVQEGTYPVNFMPVSTTGTLSIKQLNWNAPGVFTNTGNTCAGMSAPATITANGATFVTGPVTSGATAGSCTLTYQGGWTQTVTIPLTIGPVICSNSAIGVALGNGKYSNGTLCPLLIAGANANYTYGTNLQTTGGSPTATSAIAISEAQDTHAISLSKVCPAGAAISTTSIAGGTNGAAASGSVVVTAGGTSGSCTVTVNDGNGQTHTITVTIVPDPTPSPSPTPSSVQTNEFGQWENITTCTKIITLTCAIGHSFSQPVILTGPAASPTVSAFSFTTTTGIFGVLTSGGSTNPMCDYVGASQSGGIWGAPAGTSPAGVAWGSLVVKDLTTGHELDTSAGVVAYPSPAPAPTTPKYTFNSSSYYLYQVPNAAHTYQFEYFDYLSIVTPTTNAAGTYTSGGLFEFSFLTNVPVGAGTPQALTDSGLASGSGGGDIEVPFSDACTMTSQTYP